MKFLKNHPFAVAAFFDHSLVLTFGVSREQLQPLIPECLTLDTFQDQWAFLAVAMVQTRALRPKGFPKFLGHDFFLIGYRIFVRYRNLDGRRLRGLYILKSETDKKKMEWLGNTFTHYNYATTDISQTVTGRFRTIESKKSKFKVTLEQADDDVPIPEHSPFTDWSLARKFAGPLPHTFTYDESDGTVLIIQGIRQNWKPQPVAVVNYQLDFLDQLQLQNVVLASAFAIEQIPYHWKKGRLEKWK